ncbi:MAG: hypothetical protein GEU78_07760 [Actinobacteria bacterium]|nr:hypothetical protein [Actinomycetota bacterium]MQB00174.1 hypothetical protein [Actinomycetota bacterium]
MPARSNIDSIEIVGTDLSAFGRCADWCRWCREKRKRQCHEMLTRGFELREMEVMQLTRRVC